MTTRDIQQRIQDAEANLKAAELEFGSNDSRVADHLEAYAKLLKDSKLRLLDAANMEARARVIRDSNGQQNAAEVVNTALPPATILEDSPAPEFKTCPFCAEQIKAAAIKCRFCSSELPPRTEQGTRPDSIAHAVPKAEKTLGEILGDNKSATRAVAAVTTSQQAPSGSWMWIVGLSLLFGLPIVLIALTSEHPGSLAVFGLFMCLAIILYFLPTVIGKEKSNAGAIFVLNLFLGWTFIGWVVALVWATTTDKSS